MLCWILLRSSSWKKDNSLIFAATEKKSYRDEVKAFFLFWQNGSKVKNKVLDWKDNIWFRFLVSYSLISKDQDNLRCQKPLSKSAWRLSSDGVCTYNKTGEVLVFWQCFWQTCGTWRNGCFQGRMAQGVSGKSWVWTHCGNSPFCVDNCINPIGKLMCQTVTIRVWKEFSHQTGEKNHLVEFLHRLFGIQTLQGKVCDLWLFL